MLTILGEMAVNRYTITWACRSKIYAYLDVAREEKQVKSC